ncbi:MAG: dienelactone hydrolase family protein [Leptospiraceae bacterium]|nr:dienelactone hydrolase family protein [Leptospiraceae bacterium]
MQKIRIKDREIEAHYFQGGDGPKPGIIFLHDLTGIQASTLNTAEIIAKNGYHVLVPDLYGELGMPQYCLRILFDKIALTNEEGNVGLEEIQDLIDAFKAFPEVISDRLGFVGQCLTGGYVLHAALRSEIKAPILFHHSLGLTGSGFPDSCAGRLKNTVQAHFSNFDLLCPPWRANALEKQLGSKLKRYDYNLPHAIPHLFQLNDEGRRAFDNMMGFFKEHLRESPQA